ncbi:PucR family transcriptional regulator [Nocardia stercoris]|uniref:PucR family transcriptional regulator n=1 Tax=Nocardia stercoris TaxID=2483361 RepID=A0A3M2KUT3_9NOCA|nr:PucR family transcriptional regulator [Nocardia stercoris]RMI28911.1 PucR family transcriptional regulator [Nocardia stercoris]
MNDSAEPLEAPEPSVEISVRDALDLPALRRGLPEVLAAAQHLDRPIRWVHTGEVPNIATLLRGGELLLTTGMGIGDRPADQRRFIANLAERGIAGLVVELGVRFTVLPEPLIEAATAHRMPLIQLHREVPFVAVTEAIHTEIVNGHLRLLRSAEDAYRRFTDAVLADEGIPELLRMLADHIDNPVVLWNPDGRVLSYARQSELGRSEPASSPLAMVEQAAAGPALRTPIPMGSPGRLGHLVVFPVDSALTPLDRMVTDRAASLIALAMLRSRQEEDLIARTRSDFLADLAGGRVPVEDAARQAGALGLAARAMVIPVVARIPSSQRPLIGDPSGAGARWRAIDKAITAEFTRLGMSVLVGSRPSTGQILVLTGVYDGDQRTSAVERIAGALQTGARKAGITDQLLIVAGQIETWATAAAGLRHATEVAVAARPTDRPWSDARSLDADLLLWLLRDHDGLAEFVARHLTPLLDPRHRTLLLTLEAYCHYAGHKTEAAHHLRINRQTLYARIARIQTLLDTDLSDHETVMNLRLALRARRHVRH